MIGVELIQVSELFRDYRDLLSLPVNARMEPTGRAQPHPSIPNPLLVCHYVTPAIVASLSTVNINRPTHTAKMQRLMLRVRYVRLFQKYVTPVLIARPYVILLLKHTCAVCSSYLAPTNLSTCMKLQLLIPSLQTGKTNNAVFRLQQHVAIGVNPDERGSISLPTLSAHPSDGMVSKSRRQNMNFAYNFAKLRKAIISFVMTVRASARME